MSVLRDPRFLGGVVVGVVGLTLYRSRMARKAG